MKLYVIDSTGLRYHYYEAPSWKWLWSKIEHHFENERHPVTINILEDI